MENSKRKIIIQKIKQLQNKRKKHDNKISKLLNQQPEQQYNSTSSSNHDQDIDEQTQHQINSQTNNGINCIIKKQVSSGQSANPGLSPKNNYICKNKSQSKNKSRKQFNLKKQELKLKMMLNTESNICERTNRSYDVTNRSSISLSCQVNLDSHLHIHQFTNKSSIDANNKKIKQQPNQSSSRSSNRNFCSLVLSLCQKYGVKPKDIKIRPCQKPKHHRYSSYCNSSQYSSYLDKAQTRNVNQFNYNVYQQLISSQKMNDFSLIAQYISEKQLWQEIFIKKQSSDNETNQDREQKYDYFAYLYPQFDKQNRDIACLSQNSIQNYQQSLIMIKYQQIHYSQPQLNQCQQNVQLDDSSKQTNRKVTIYIGYLLLYRLMNYLQTGHAPVVLQKILGFPYTKYELNNTKQYIKLQNKLFNNNNIINLKNQRIILGQLCLDGSLQLVQQQILKCKKNLNTQILQKYQSITVIEQMHGICVTKVDVLHRNNHYIVLDLQHINTSKDKINYQQYQNQEVADNCGSQSNYKCIWLSFNNKNTNFNSNNVEYRYCLLQQNGNILQYSKPYHKEGQSFLIKLQANKEYKLLVGQVFTQQKEHNELLQGQYKEFNQFSIVLQSNQPLSPLQLRCELKFNEQYNNFYQKIINKYLNNSKNLDQVYKQFVKISHICAFNQKNNIKTNKNIGEKIDLTSKQDISLNINKNGRFDVLVVRAKLKIMGLAVDFVALQSNNQYQQLKQREFIQIKYDGFRVLCDKNYKKNIKILSNSTPQIYQIYLSKQVPILQIKGYTYSYSQLIL